MAFTRSHLYTQRDHLAGLFARALSHPARITILRQLHQGGPMTVEELGKFHPLSQPTLSQHLSILRKAQLVEFKEKNPYTYYSLNNKTVNICKKLLMDFLGSV